MSPLPMIPNVSRPQSLFVPTRASKAADAAKVVAVATTTDDDVAALVDAGTRTERQSLLEERPIH